MVRPMRRCILHSVTTTAWLLAAVSVAAIAAQTRSADHVVPSRPETVVWGWIPIDRRPVGVRPDEILHDVRDLTAGSTLYLPVFHRGALFYVGDPHGVQDNGEVSGNALEQSLTGVFSFRVHKGKSIAVPRAETPTHYILMGIDIDLDRAMRRSAREASRQVSADRTVRFRGPSLLEAVTFLIEEKRMTAAKALSLASLAVDFQVAEAVDLAQLVAAKIPKDVFLKK